MSIQAVYLWPVDYWDRFLKIPLRKQIIIVSLSSKEVSTRHPSNVKVPILKVKWPISFWDILGGDLWGES